MSAVVSSPCGSKHSGTAQHTIGLQSGERKSVNKQWRQTDSMAAHHVCLFIRPSHSHVLWHKTFYRKEMNCVSHTNSLLDTHTHTHTHTPSGKPAVISSCFSCSCGEMKGQVRGPDSQEHEAKGSTYSGLSSHPEGGQGKVVGLTEGPLCILPLCTTPAKHSRDQCTFEEPLCYLGKFTKCSICFKTAVYLFGMEHACLCKILDLAFSHW